MSSRPSRRFRDSVCIAFVALFTLAAGRAAAVPNIVVTPSSVADTLAAGDSTQRMILISNTGTDSLHYSIQFTSSSDSVAARRPVPYMPKPVMRGPDQRSDRVPKGYRPEQTPLFRSSPGTLAGGRKVLMIEDAYPWGSSANEQVLASNAIPYDVIPTAQLATVDFTNYSLVLVPSDQTPEGYANLASHMSRLATFVSQGGTLEFHAACFGMNGGNSTGLVLPGGMSITTSFSYQDTILLPAHPAVQGLLNPFNGNYAAHVAFQNLPSGTHVIVQNSYGSLPDLVEYSHGAGTVIASGHTLEFGYQYGESTGHLLANLIPYAYSRGHAWLTLSDYAGVVPPGGAHSIDMTLDATALVGGAYALQIAIDCDDPDEPRVTVAVQLHVIGIPDVLVTPVVHDFGSRFVGGEDSVAVRLRNRGSDALLGSATLTGDAAFSGGVANFVIGPLDSLDTIVRFAPTALGPVAATLHVDSNDPDEPSLAVGLTGTGAPAPDIVVSPDSLLVGLVAGEAAKRIVTVNNGGGADLAFEAYVEGTDPDSLSSTPGRIVGVRVIPPAPAAAAVREHGDERRTPALHDEAFPRRGPPVPPAVQSRATAPFRAHAPFEFADGFEDGNYDGWYNTGGSAVDVTSSTAARGARSLHQFSGLGGHFAGLLHPFGSEHPTAMSFWIRCAANNHNTAYVVISDSLGNIPLFFFASDQGTFMVNPDVGGSWTYPYVADAWYHIELRNMDWMLGRFDFAVNGALVQSGISMYAGYASNVAAVHAYNYDANQHAWWDEFELTSRPHPEWLDVSPVAGVIPAGGSAELVVRLDATSLFGGGYDARVGITSNDPDERVVNVPVRLEVAGTPDIRLQGPDRRVESVQMYTSPGAVTLHSLPVSKATYGSVEVELAALGDYGDISEYATLIVEGDTLGTTRSTGADCLPSGLRLLVPEAMFAGWAANFTVDATVANSYNVDPSCMLNAHHLILHPRGPADSVAFVPTFVGGCAAETLRIANTGTEVLHVSAIGTDNATFSVSPVSVEVPPHDVRDLVVRFCPTAIGAVSAALSVTSDDPDAGSVASHLVGEGVEPPVIGVTPDSLSAALLTGDSTSAVLTVRNTGASDLAFQADALLVASVPMPARVSGAPSRAPAPQSRWGAPAAPAGARRVDAAGPGSRTHLALPVVLTDPTGDAATPDLVQVRGMSQGDTLHVQLVFAATLNPFDFGGAFSLDTDQNATTGTFPSYGNGAQDARVEYEIYLFGVPYGYVDVFSTTLGYMGSPPVAVRDNVLELQVPLAMLGNDDGNMDFSSVIGSGTGPTDWAPDAGHGTLRRFDWLAVAPAQGVVAPGASQPLDVRFNADGLFGGGYEGQVLVSSNDPVTPRVAVPVHLQVTGVPNIAFSPDSLNYGARYIGTATLDSVRVTNTGTEVLNVTPGVVADSTGGAFSTIVPGFALAPGDSAKVRVTFAPAAAGPASGTLQLASDDPDQPLVSLPLRGVGLEPPDIAVTPDSILAGLNVGEMTPRVVRIDNTGGGELTFVVDATPAGPPSDSLTLRARVHAPELDPATWPREAAPGPQDRLRAASRVDGGGVPPDPIGFFDSFEDGNVDGWIPVAGGQILATPQNPAHGNYSLQVQNQNGGLYSGAFRDFGASQPRHIAFDIRLPDVTHYAGYFVVTDPNGYDPIFFLAMPGGTFLVNDSYYGDATVPYLPNTWYHVEFRNIDWSSKTFDYVVDGVLRKAGIPFRYAYTAQSMSRVNVFNYDAGSTAWYDDIQVELTPNVSWLRIDPLSGVVPPGGHADLAVMLDATRLLGGDYDAAIHVANNDPDEPVVSVPVHLDVTGIPNIAVTADSVAFGPRFIGTTTTKSVKVFNAGTDTLSGSTGMLEGAGGTTFGVAPPLFTLAPGESVLVQVSYTPVASVASTGTLKLTSNDPDQSVVNIAVSGLGQVPPEIGVTPDSLLAGLYSGETVTRTLRIENTGGSELVWSIAAGVASGPGDSTAAHAKHSAQLDAAAAPPRAPDASGDPAHAGKPADASAGQTMAGGADFFDGFEDGDANGWTTNPGHSTTTVTSETAARGQYSLRNTSLTWAHFGGASRLFGPRRVNTVAFDVRLADTQHNAGYVVLTDSLGYDVIWFFAMAGGTFYVNDYYYGDAAVPYTANTWYHVEFRDINWTTKTFDYYVNGVLRKAGIGMRNAYTVQNLTTVYLYSADQGATAWWDNVGVRTGPRWLSMSPHEGIVAPGAHADVNVTIDAHGLLGGTYDAALKVASNDLDEAEVLVPVHLDVTGVPNIAVTPDSVAFGPRFIGTTTTRAVQVNNTGTDTLSGSTNVIVAGMGNEFTAAPPSFVLAPGESTLVQVSYAPVAATASVGTLEFASNDPDQPVRTVALSGVGLVPPEIGVTPDSMLAGLYTGGTLTRTLRIENTGGSDLAFSIIARDLTPPTAASSPAAAVATRDDIAPIPATRTAGGSPGAGMPVVAGGWMPAALASATPAAATRGTPTASQTPDPPPAREPDARSNPAATPEPQARSLASRAPRGPVVASGGFLDGFEDGNADGWVISPYSVVVVTDSTAAHGTHSLKITSTYGGSYEGAYRATGPTRPSQVAFDVRLPDTIHDAGHFVLADSAGWEVIHFFAAANGRFVVSDGYSADFSVPYAANTWHHVEFRNIDWTTKAFDYYVDGTLRRQGLELRNGAVVGNVSTVYLYNFDYYATAWWDDITVSAVPPWLRLEPAAGVVPAGGHADVAVTLDAAGLFTGNYDALLSIASNDIDEETTGLPVRLQVTGRPDIAVARQVADLLSTQTYSSYGATTFHDFPVEPGGHALGAQIDLTLTGDYFYGYQYAVLVVEGTLVGTTGQVLTTCGSRTFTFPVTPARFDPWAADGIVHAQVANNPNVSPYCPQNTHALRLRYFDIADSLRYGTRFTGVCVVETLLVKNHGTEVLHLTSVVVSGGPFTVTDTIGALVPGQSATLGVQFCPSVPGTFSETLTLQSDDPDEGSIVVALTGSAIGAPVVVLSPASFSASLITGATDDQALHVENTGGSDLTVSLDVLPTGSPTPPPKASPARTDTGGDYDLPVVLADFLGDGYPVDVVALRSSAFSDSFRFQIDFSGPINFLNFNGLVSLDTDENPLTGIHPSTELPAHDIGADYEILLFNVGSMSQVEVYKTSPNYVFVHAYPVLADGARLRFAVPLAALGGDDGDVNFVGAVGTYYSLTDWFPESGHGPTAAFHWVSLSARDLVVPAGGATDVNVHFDAAGLEGGDYTAMIRAISNDPQRPLIGVPVVLHVTGAPDIALRPDSVGFGDVAVGDTGQVTVWISNRGTGPLAGSAVASTTGSGSLFGPDAAVSFAIAAHESVAVQLTFAPAATGPASGSLTVASDDPDEGTLIAPLNGLGIVGPHLVMTPDHLDATVMVGTSEIYPLVMRNTGDRPLHWAASTVVSGPALVEAAMEPVTSRAAALPKPADGVTPALAHNGPLVTLAARGGAPSSPMSRVASMRGVSPGRAGRPRLQSLALEEVRVRLDERASGIAAAIPNRFNFTGGEAGYSISDGGLDMYDTGNLIATNLGGPIAYSNSGISTTGLFGNAGRYMTRKYPGLWVLAADLDGVGLFDVYGDLGADGVGSVDGAVLSMTANGSSFKGFVKRVFDTGDASVNHLIVVKESPGLKQLISSNTNDDYHELQGLTASDRIYLLVYAATGSAYIDNAATQEIMRRFLDAVEPSWMYASPESGTVAPGGSSTLNVTLDATELEMGDHNGELRILSNDPIQASFVVSVVLHADTTTAVALSLVEARAEPGAAHLAWRTPGGAPVTATVYRREEPGAWAALGTVTSDGEGMLRWDDITVRAGRRYGYRLGVVENGIESFGDEVRIEIPTSSLAFALHGPQPNPATAELRVRFTLPDASAASLELLDLAGRRVAMRDVGGMGAGEHTVALGESHPIPAGVYLIRLTRGGSTLNRKAVVME